MHPPKKYLRIRDIIPTLKTALEKSEFERVTIRKNIKRGYELIDYMEINHITKYTPTVGASFLFEQRFRSQWIARNAAGVVNKLNLILKGADIFNTNGIIVKIREFPGQIGEQAKDYLMSHEYRKDTYYIYQTRLSHFCVAMVKQGIDLQTLSSSSVLAYLFGINRLTRHEVGLVRNFLKYCFERGLIGFDPCCFDDIKISEHKKLPSVFSSEEIKQLENSIDRSRPVGKRDYAMTLLASRLGIRADDICNLQFSNIDWDNCTISYIQQKTRTQVILPLLEEVGEAIIDYIMSGRPKTTSKHIFVSHTNPKTRLVRASLTIAIKKYFKYSRVNINGRHSGPHSLRHSLATALMNGGVQMPVISEIMGHKCTTSTMYYLKVDLNSLIDCSLIVPPVEKD